MSPSAEGRSVNRGGRFAGRFEKLERLGSGGMATVWLARDHDARPFTGDRTVALKVLHRHLADDPSALQRFELEGRAMIGFRHPNIVKVFDQESDGDDHFLVMEYVSGGSLKDTLEKRAGAVPPGDAVAIVSQVCAGIQYAHDKGVIHRDVKPANVMVVGSYAEGEPPRVEVTDFGVARARWSSLMTQTGVALGTPGYMAPETAATGEATRRSDVYGCGALLYRLLTGSEPFGQGGGEEILKRQRSGGPAPPSALAAVGEALDEATMVALEGRPEDRYESAEKMRLAVEAALAGGDVGDLLPTRYLAPSGPVTGPTLFRRHGRQSGPVPPENPPEQWLSLIKFLATVVGLTIIFAVGLRLVSAIWALPLWIVISAAGVAAVAVGLRRSALFGGDASSRIAARRRLGRSARSVFVGLLIVALAVYWAVLGYHLADTVTVAIDRQPPASHLWLELGSAAVWIAVALLPLRWLLRSRMRVGRTIALAVVTCLVWTGGAEFLPRAPQAVADLFWQRQSVQHRVRAEGKRWTAVLREPGVANVEALRGALRESRDAQLRALRRAGDPAAERQARREAKRWLKVMRGARDDWDRPRCDRPRARLLITYGGAMAICP